MIEKASSFKTARDTGRNKAWSEKANETMRDTEWDQDWREGSAHKVPVLQAQSTRELQTQAY